VGGQYYFYQNDHLGTPQKLTAVNGADVWSAKYSSFGEALIDLSSTVINNLRFPGQYFDNETGLYFNYHRYYDPRTGRYLKVDPIGFKGGLNLYNYAGNNPSNMIDSFGLKKWRIEQSSFSASLLVIGGTIGSICFKSDCVQEPDVRKSPEGGWEDEICYWVFGGGLTVGLEFGWTGDSIGALVDETNFSEEYPDPKGGMYIAGPSVGAIAGVTTVSADIAFNSYSNIGAGKVDWMIGASIFNAEGRTYKFRHHIRRSCGCGGNSGGGVYWHLR
jgi:RHS repeat-associated protein